MRKALLPRIFILLCILPSCNNSLAGDVEGCTDPLADNYHPEASLNDGSCTYASTIMKPASSMELPEVLVENSGLLFWEGKLWTHNDSEDTHLYAIDTATAEIVERILLPGVVNTDWEDIAQDEQHIYLGDFGNNLGNRKDLHILKIEKASLRSGTPRIDRINFAFEGQEDFSQRPKGHDYDCEAMTLVGDRILLFTKQWQSGGTEVHLLENKIGTQTSKLLDSLKVEGLITGATSSDDDQLIALSGYTVLIQPFILILSDFPADDVFGGNKRKIQIDLPYHQVEGISLAAPGQLFLGNESFNPGFLPSTVQQLHSLTLPGY